MRSTIVVGSIALASLLALVQACSKEAEATADSVDGGPGTSGAPGTSSGDTGTSDAPGSSGDTGTSGTSGGPDSGKDAAEGVDTGGKSLMTFFVSSTGSGAMGGNLGGLAGADLKCTQLAAAVSGSDHTWKAYLSTNTNNGGTLVHAKNRIGSGPWRNKNGVLIANDVTALHAASITSAQIIDENGATVPNTIPYPTSVHDILTGSNADGTARTENCENWTSTASGTAYVGHTDSETAASPADTWSSAHETPNCSTGALNATAGEGRVYCFAID